MFICDAVMAPVQTDCAYASFLGVREVWLRCGAPEPQYRLGF